MKITRHQLRRIIREAIGPSYRYDVRGEPISSLDPEAYKSIQRTIVEPGLDPDEQADYDEIEYERGYQDGLQDYVKSDDELPDYYAGYEAGRLDADLPETDWRASRSEDW